MKTSLFIISMFMSITMIAQNYKFGKVSAEEIQQTQHPEHPDADAAILYREYITKFDYSQDEGFYVKTDVFERIKIYTPEGFDWATHKVTLYDQSNRVHEEFSGLKAYTYFLNAKGKVDDIKLSNSDVFEEEINKYYKQKKFTMPSIKEGSVIEYEYTIKSPFVSNIDPYRMQESIPVDKVYVSFKVPEYYNYKTHTKGWIPFDIEKSSTQRSMNYRYTRSFSETKSAIGNTTTETVKFREDEFAINLEKVPPIIREAYAGNINNYRSSIAFELAYTRFPSGGMETYATDWEAVSNKIYRSEAFGGQLAQTKYFQNDLVSLIEGASSKNEKIIKIYEYVKNYMNHNGFRGVYADNVKKAYKEKVGTVSEINLMLVSMLREAGINANPILVSTKSNGIPFFPTRSGFDYVIAGVENQGYVDLFDASDKQGVPNILNEELLNWQGRLIRQDGSSSWVPLVSNRPSRQTFMMNYDITEDAVVKGKTRGQYTDYAALEKRDAFKNQQDSEIQGTIETTQLTLNEFKIENLKNPYEALKMEFAFEGSEFVEEIDGSLYFSPLLFWAINENPFKSDERKYPIDYGFAKAEKYIINIKVPDGYKVESLPESANMIMGNNTIIFKYLVTNNNPSVIQVMVDFTITAPLIEAGKYQDVKRFYQDLINKEQEKIVLSKA